MAEDKPAGESNCGPGAKTATGPSKEAIVASPLSDELRQEHVELDCELLRWCIGHSVAPT